MKKLMIAAATVAMSVAAFASTAKWSVAESYEKGGSTLAEGYAVYFFDSTYAGSVSYANAQSYLADGDLSFLSGMAGTKMVLTDEEGYANGVTGGIYDSSKAVTVNGYVVILDAAVPDDASFAYLSDVVPGETTAVGGSANIKFGKLTGMQSDSTVTSGSGWYAIPEPTSGLLLLIGVAGLALRRRRA